MFADTDSGATTFAPLTVLLGAETAAAEGRLSVGLPVLRGSATEALYPDARPAGRAGDFQLFRSNDLLLGCASVPLEGDLQLASRRTYTTLLDASHDWHLCRIWNYVPGINAEGPGGLENYRAFSAGRSVAFEAALGRGFTRQLPAASAVGSRDGRLTVVFAAVRQEVVHRENPVQVPAYEYPSQYGPRAPSFSRSSIVMHPDSARDVYVSGTAAIRGHLSVARDDTAAQVTCMVENLREISRVSGLGDDLGAGRAAQRHAKVYLRHAGDLAVVAEELESELWRRGDQVTYLLADVCRAELNVEVEVSVFGFR